MIVPKWWLAAGKNISVALGLVAVLMVVMACGSSEATPTPTLSPTSAATATSAPVATSIPASTATAAPPPTPATATGTIAGSVLTLAMETLGSAVAETRASPFDGCRPGCLPIKDDFFLLDPEGQLTPHVIKSWEFGPDTKHWVLRMRDDIVFHNGRPADAEDLEFSIFEGQYLAKFTVPSGAYAAPFVKATRRVVSKYTLEIEFAGPTVALAEMALTINQESTGLRPKKEILEQGYEAWLSKPILSGPYVIKKEVPGEVIEYEVFRGWWHKPAPDWERMSMRGVPEAATRLALATTRQADVIAISAVTLPQALKVSGLKIIEQPSTVHTQLFFLNTFRPGDPGYDPDWPFLKKEVREAFNIAIDRDLILKTIYSGRSQRQDAPMMARGMKGWDHPTTQAMMKDPIPFNPARARQLLSAANFPTGMPIKMVQGTALLSGAPELNELNEAVLTQLRQNLGLNVLLEKADTTQVLNPQRKELKKVDYTLYAGERMSTEPLISTRATYINSKNGHNYYLPGDAEVSSLREQILGSTDPAVVARQSAELSKYMRDNWTHIPLTTNPLFYGVLSDRVKSWPLTVGAPWAHYFEYIGAVR